MRDEWWSVGVVLALCWAGCSAPPRAGAVEQPPSRPADGEVSLSRPPPVPPAAGPASRVDLDRLAEAFAAIGYEPPPGTHLLAAREVSGAHPGFDWFSLGDTGFVGSQDRYWPASTVKLITAVAALQTMARLGQSGAARISFVDDDGPYFGTVRQLAFEAVRVSSNAAYNRTVLVTGFDELNDQILPAWGLHHTVLQRRYTRPPGVTELSLRHSPPMRWTEGEARGAIPARVGTGRHPECPNEGNCTTLFELLEVLRRVVLHFELPPAERFELRDADADALRMAMLTSRSRMALGAEAAFGEVVVYNKTGTVPGDDRLDHGLVVQLETGRRFLLALALPYNTTDNSDAQELARQTLIALGER